LGYVEGRNVAIEWRPAQGKFERLPEPAADLVRLNVDVIVAPAPPHVRAARKATSSIPIVFALVGDPVGEGFVASLARPGGNTTGVSSMSGELVSKRLELIRLVPPDQVTPWRFRHHGFPCLGWGRKRAVAQRRGARSGSNWSPWRRR
jgi:putative ABC transport system substrate-binding protein